MKRSSQTATTGEPEKLADRLMLQIFRGDHPIGERLPAERQLAAELGTDRTTLRMALKQLQRMKLLVARHGSGVVVNDWREHGGLDVLAAMFSLEQLPLEGSFIVEALDFWLEMLGTMVAKAVGRMSLDEMRGIERVLEAGIAAAGDPDATAAAVMEVQDRFAALSGSVFFRMLSNSTRSVRARISRMLHDTVDVEEALGEMRQLLRTAALRRPGEDEARRALIAALRRTSEGLRARLLFGATPARRTRTKRR